VPHIDTILIWLRHPPIPLNSVLESGLIEIVGALFRKRGHKKAPDEAGAFVALITI
jgi:hypothetical protein